MTDPSETTGALVPERYEIAPPAPRHGFAPPFTLMGVDREVPVGLWGHLLTAKASDTLAGDWMLLLHALGWQKSRATRYPCSHEWLEGSSFEDETYCLKSSIPDVVAATTEAFLFVMAAHVRIGLECRCTTHPAAREEWHARFGVHDPTQDMAFREDLPAREHALTGSLYGLVERLASLAGRLCEQFPSGDITCGEDTVGYDEMVADMGESLEETARSVWCHPALGPSHAEDLRQKFEAIQATARQYPARLHETMADYRRRANRVLMVYLKEFGRDVKPLYEELGKQGGLGLESGVFSMHLPGGRRKAKTVEGIAEEMRTAYTERSIEDQHRQSEFREEVVRFVELLTTLNNTIVVSCSGLIPERDTEPSTETGKEGGTPPSATMCDADRERQDRVKYWVALAWYKKWSGRPKKKYRKQFCDLSGLPYVKKKGQLGIDTLERWAQTPTGQASIKKYGQASDVQKFLADFKREVKASNASDTSESSTSD